MKLSKLYSREWIVVTVSCVLGLIFIALFLPRASQQVDVMEQRRFDLRLAELNAALRLRSLELIVRNKSHHLEQGANPFVWLDFSNLEENISVFRYLGEHPVRHVNDARGNWLYDPESRLVGYLPSIDLKYQGKIFEEGQWVWFQVQPSHSEGTHLWQLMLKESIQ